MKCGNPIAISDSEDAVVDVVEKLCRGGGFEPSDEFLSVVCWVAYCLSVSSCSRFEARVLTFIAWTDDDDMLIRRHVFCGRVECLNGSLETITRGVRLYLFGVGLASPSLRAVQDREGLQIFGLCNGSGSALVAGWLPCCSCTAKEGWDTTGPSTNFDLEVLRLEGERNMDVWQSQLTSSTIKWALTEIVAGVCHLDLKLL